jgi:hypothetical protein
MRRSLSKSEYTFTKLNVKGDKRPDESGECVMDEKEHDLRV